MEELQARKDTLIQEITDIVKQFTPVVGEQTTHQIVKAVERFMNTGGVEKRDGRDRS